MKLKDLVEDTLNVAQQSEIDNQSDHAIMHGLVTFDTNILLDLYNLGEQDLRSLFTSLSGDLKSRLWLTHQVAFEYSKLRDTRARSKKKKLQDFLDSQQGILNSLEDRIIQPLKNYKIIDDVIAQSIPDWRTPLISWLEAHNEVVKRQISYFEKFADPKDDSILNQLDNLFNNQVGDPLPTSDLISLLQNGQTRYKFNIPPGFSDKGKSDKKKIGLPIIDYGDLILWEQLILFAISTDFQSVLLISRDNKEDWLENMPVVSGDSTHLILRRDLHREFKERTGKDISVLNLEDFLRAAQRLGVLTPVPPGELGQLLSNILREDYQRLLSIRSVFESDLLRQQFHVEAAKRAIELLDLQWIEHDQLEAPDANQAYVQYRRNQEKTAQALQTMTELLTNTTATLERIDDQIRLIKIQLSEEIEQ